MFDIKENEEYFEATVSLEKRVFAKDKKIYIFAADAKKAILEKYPEAKMESNPEKNEIVSNTSEPHNFTWKFKKKQVEKENKKIKNIKRVVESASKNNEGQNPFTNSKKSATVEQTAQSDQPAIVQEPAE